MLLDYATLQLENILDSDGTLTVKVRDVAGHLPHEWSGDQNKAESDLGNINPDGVVNHQNVAVALSHRMLWKIVRLREAHFNLYEEADGDLGKRESCFFFCHEDDILRPYSLHGRVFLQLHFTNVTALWRGFETFFLRSRGGRGRRLQRRSLSLFSRRNPGQHSQVLLPTVESVTGSKGAVSKLLRIKLVRSFGVIEPDFTPSGTCNTECQFGFFRVEVLQKPMTVQLSV